MVHRIVLDDKLTKIVRKIVEWLGLDHIDVDRVAVVRNLDSRSNAFARIHALPRVFSVAFGIEPRYVIEIIDRNFKHLDCEKKLEVLVHELMHIPKNFSGGLRPHTAPQLKPSFVKNLVYELDLDDLCRELMD